MFLLRAWFVVRDITPVNVLGYHPMKNVRDAGVFNTIGDKRRDILKRNGVSEDNFQPGLNVLFSRLSKIFRTHQERRARELRRRLNAGSADLTNCEVLQLVLEPVLDGVDTKAVAETLLKKFRTFGDVVNAPAIQLMTVSGLNEAGAAALKTVGVAAIHMLRQPVDDVTILCTSESVMDYVTARLLYERTEVFVVLYLDARHRLIKAEELWRGTIDHVPFYPREVVRRCLELDAAVIIIAHKKMSGSGQAAQRDIEITEDLVNAAAVFDITVMDHIIIDRDESFSMRERDLL